MLYSAVCLMMELSCTEEEEEEEVVVVIVVVVAVYNRPTT